MHCLENLWWEHTIDGVNKCKGSFQEEKMSADSRQRLPKYFSPPETSELRAYWLTAVTNFLGSRV